MSNSLITIHRMIVHKIDHINDSAPHYSDLESPISDEIGAFFIRQIMESREHKNARSGVFRPKELGKLSIQELCDGLTEDVATFIDHSRILAGHLFDCIHGDGRITTSDLVVLTFSELQDTQPWIAIMKMDQNSGLVGEAQEINGKTQIVLTPVGSVLTNNNLQKCAFILPKEQRNETRHLVILDQQASRFGTGQIAATFFVTNFLQTDLGGNTYVKTDTFYWASVAWLETKRDQWGDHAVEQLEARVHSALTEPLVDVEAIARSTIQRVQDQDEYILHIRVSLLKKGINDLVFEPDHTYAKERQYAYFVGDNGLKIRVPVDEIGRDKTFFFETDPATGQVNVQINTTTLRRVRR